MAFELSLGVGGVWTESVLYRFRGRGDGLAPNEFLRGQVGTVVERLAPDVYEVEFSDDNGRTYATLSLRADQLLQLHHE